MPTLAEAVSLPAEKNLQQRCGTREWIKSLPPAEAEAAIQLLADKTRSNASLHRLFVENGFSMGPEPLRKHRIGICSCP